MKIKTQKFIRLFVVFVSLLINAIFFIIIVAQWHSIRPTVVKIVKPIIYSISKQELEDLNNIKEYIDSQNFSSESERIDFIRNWVYEKSIHKIDTEHKKYAFNTPRVLSMLWKTHQTTKGHAHLSCGPRAMAMKSILEKLEIQNRIISIFTDDNPEVNSHTFLEVFNKETKRWELQDPDFNIYYIALDTQERVATAQLIWGDLDSITPVSIDKKGWKNNNVEHLKQHYFETLMYMNHLNGEKSVILINIDRFNAEKVFEKNGNIDFYQFANKHYSNPIFIENQGFNGK